MTPIKVTVIAETQPAAAAMQDFVQETDAGLKQVEKSAGHSASALGSNRIAMMELGHVARATGEGLAAGMSPLRVLALESPRVVQALSFMGISLGTIGLGLASMLPLLATGYTAFETYRAGIAAAESELELFAQTQSLAARNLKALNDALDKKLITPEDFIYLQKMLSIGSESALRTAQAKLAELGISAGQISNYEKLQKLEEQMRIGAMSSLDAEQAKAQEVYEKRLAEIAKLADASLMAANERKQAEALTSSEYNAVSNKITEQKQAKASADLIKEIEEDLFFHQRALGEKQKFTADEVFRFRVDKFREATKAGIVSEEQFTAYFKDQVKAHDADQKQEIENAKRLNKELERQAQLAQAIARAQVEGQLASIRGNPFLTDSEKQAQSVPLMADLYGQNQQRIGQLQQDALDPDQKLEAQKQLVELLREQADLSNQINAAEHPWATVFKDLKSAAEINMASLASTFKGVFDGAIHSISSGITGLIMGTQTWSQALRGIAASILTEIVSAIVQMGVRWIATQILMAVAGRSILAAAVATTIPMAAAQSAIWAVPATLATIASFGGAAIAAPGFIGMAEAITLGTAGFADGGYTGSGGKYDFAGAVHKGEYVFNQEAVNRIGVNNLDAMHNGGSGGAAGGLSNVHVHFDERAMVNHLERSTNAENWVVNIMARNVHKFRS
jgi:hypothetical protein